jgi:hypothetical protein
MVTGDPLSSSALHAGESRERTSNPTETFAVIDLIYILTTLAFFGLMIVYVRACEHLGRAPSNDAKSAGDTP